MVSASSDVGDVDAAGIADDIVWWSTRWMHHAMTADLEDEEEFFNSASELDDHQVDGNFVQPSTLEQRSADLLWRSAHLLPECTRPSLRRRLAPRQPGPGVPEEPFPGDSLPSSAPVARSVPPAAEVEAFYRSEHSLDSRFAPSEALSSEAHELIMIGAAQAFQRLAAAAREEACNLIQLRWRSRQHDLNLEKQRAALRLAAATVVGPSSVQETVADSARTDPIVVRAVSSDVMPSSGTPAAPTGPPSRAPRRRVMPAVPPAASDTPVPAAVRPRPEALGSHCIVPDETPADTITATPRRSRAAGSSARHKLTPPEQAAKEPSPVVPLPSPPKAPPGGTRSRRSSRTQGDHAKNSEGIAGTTMIRLDLEDSGPEGDVNELPTRPSSLARTYMALGTEVFCMDSVCGQQSSSPKFHSSPNFLSQFPGEGREMKSPKTPKQTQSSPAGASSPRIGTLGRVMNRLRTPWASPDGAQKSSQVSADVDAEMSTGSTRTLGKDDSGRKPRRSKTAAAPAAPSAMELDLGLTTTSVAPRSLGPDEGVRKPRRTKEAPASGGFLPLLPAGGAAGLSTSWTTRGVSEMTSPRGARRLVF